MEAEELRMSGLYPIRAVAKLTGLTIDTLRQWERRYAAVVPERSTRGRQYSGDQIDRLMLLRQAVERGHSIGQIASLGDLDLRGLLEGGAGIAEQESAAQGSLPPSPRHPRQPPSYPLDGLIDAFCSFQFSWANAELSRLAALLAPRDLIFQVVLPMMREVGARWHRSEIGVAQEHLISSAVRNLLGSLVRLLPARSCAPDILIATLSGELHEFGILAATMIAATNGLNPLLLGPNLPAADLAAAAAVLSPGIILVDSTSAEPHARAELASLAHGLPRGTELWVGGHGIAWLRTSVLAGTIVIVRDMESFEDLCRIRALGRTQPAG